MKRYAPLFRLHHCFPLKYVCFVFFSGVAGLRTEEESKDCPCGREDFSQNGSYDGVGITPHKLSGNGRWQY